MLNERVRILIQSTDDDNIAMQIISLACDTHTTFVHIHPFPDGNGRLARILSGLVLQAFGLPMPMFLREESHKYISAVAAATIDIRYSDLCYMHAEAVLRSLQFINDLS